MSQFSDDLVDAGVVMSVVQPDEAGLAQSLVTVAAVDDRRTTAHVGTATTPRRRTAQG